MSWLVETIGPPWVLMLLRCVIFALCLGRAAQAQTLLSRVTFILLGLFSLGGVLSGYEDAAPQTTWLTLGLNAPLALLLLDHWLHGPRGPRQK